MICSTFIRYAITVYTQACFFPDKLLAETREMIKLDAVYGEPVKEHLNTLSKVDATLSQDLHVISRVSDNFKQVKEIMADFPNLADKLQPLDYKDPDGDRPMGS